MRSSPFRIMVPVLLAIAIPAAGFVPLVITARWVLAAILIILFMIFIGWLETGRLGGFLIDNRNKFSLSRLQLVAWTILIISAYSTAAFWNIAHQAEDPLTVAIPAQIWALMGISVTSFVGAPIVKSAKRTTGQLAENAAPTEARSTDMFKEEEQGREQAVDLGKVQMFLFTLIVFVAYATAIGAMLLEHESRRAVVQEFPSLSEGMLALLGLSHSGYLAYKAVPKT